ncbi:hypothetical protein PENTCL1PPCAC_24774, partial [Pristionchus entomophagus]
RQGVWTIFRERFAEKQEHEGPEHDYYENFTHANGWRIVSRLATFASIDSKMRELEFNDPKRMTNAHQISVMLKRDLPY